MLSGYSEAGEAAAVRGTQTGQTETGPQHNMTTVAKLRTKVNISTEINFRINSLTSVK